MFLRAFKFNSPISIIAIPVLAVLLWIYAFTVPLPSFGYESMPMYGMIVSWLYDYPLLMAITAFVIIILTAFLFNYIVNEHEYLSRRTYLPAWFYALFMSSTQQLLQLHPIIFANLFIVLVLNALLKMYRSTVSYVGAFEAGMYISLASLFYFPAIMMLPFGFIALGILRPFVWREWIINIVGFITPYLYVFVFYYWNNQANEFIYQKIINPIANANLQWSFFVQKNPVLWMFTGLLLLSLAWTNSGFSGQKLKTQKAYMILFWMLAFAIISLFIAAEVSMITLSMLAVPSAIIYSNYFFSVKREWIGRLLLWVLYLMIFAVIWGNKIYSL